MPNFNSVTLIGHLGRDPELRHTQNNKAVCGFSMAISRKVKDRDDEVTWVDVTAWDRIAEVVNEYVKKGDPIMVQGRLRLDEWEDKTTGSKRTKLCVVAETVQLLGGKSGDSKPKPKPAPVNDISLEDIPF